jgi:sporulation protein YlmC with PRC-barrel domain
MLHKAKALLGYHIVATDGEIGHVDDFLLDDAGREVRYLVVDTSNWIGGRSVLISTSAMDHIDSPAAKIHVNLTRDTIKRAPSSETAEIEPSETLPVVWIM